MNESVLTIATAIFGTGGVGVAVGKWFLNHISKMDEDRTRITERLLDVADKRNTECREELIRHREADRDAREQERSDFLEELTSHRKALAEQEQECSRQREQDRKLLEQILARREEKA